MATPLIAGLSVAAAAIGAREAIGFYQVWKAAPRVVKYFEGGFEQSMSRREAARILNIRETASEEKVKEAHKKVMVANHPDSGGSDYLATKVNEAKDILLGKKGSGGMNF